MTTYYEFGEQSMIETELIYIAGTVCDLRLKEEANLKVIKQSKYKKISDLVKFLPLRLCKNINIELKKHLLMRLKDLLNEFDISEELGDFMFQKTISKIDVQYGSSCRQVMRTRKEGKNNKWGKFAGLVKHLEESTLRETKTKNTAETKYDNDFLIDYINKQGEQLNLCSTDEKQIEDMIAQSVEFNRLRNYNKDFPADSLKGGAKKRKRVVKRVVKRKTTTGKKKKTVARKKTVAPKKTVTRRRKKKEPSLMQKLAGLFA